MGESRRRVLGALAGCVAGFVVLIGCTPPGTADPSGPGGSSTTTTTTTTTTPPTVVSSALNFDHSCALLSTGSIRCYGENDRGQLGNGTTTRSLTAVDVQSAATFSSIGEAQGKWSCALTATGTAQCWGYNAYGQLGDGTTTDRSTPVAVNGLGGVTEIATGNTHACALLADATLRCWGDSYFGELGAGNVVGTQLSPIPVVGLTDVTGVEVGNLRTCATVESGALHCWGSNTNGGLGDGTTVQRNTPVQVLGVQNAVDVELGSGGHTCVVELGGTVKCWGSNNFGAIGLGSAPNSLTPVVVEPLAGAIDVAAGYAHTCGLFGDGTVSCIGMNTDGQLGDGTTTSRRTFATVPGLTGVLRIDASSYNTCADTATERFCWGRNGSGQVGDTTTAPRPTPTLVTALG